MGASSNAEVMRRYVEAWERNDSEVATALWDDDVVHHVPGRSPLVGDFQGKQAFLDHYGKVFAELGGTIEVVEFHDVLLSEDHAVALVKERAVEGYGPRSSTASSSTICGTARSRRLEGKAIRLAQPALRLGRDSSS